MPPIAVSVETATIVAVSGVSAVLLVLIVVAPWRRVREEPPLDPDVQTRLLLGEDPDQIDADLAPDPAAAPVADLRPDEPTA